MFCVYICVCTYECCFAAFRNSTKVTLAVTPFYSTLCQGEVSKTVSHSIVSYVYTNPPTASGIHPSIHPSIHPFIHTHTQTYIQHTSTNRAYPALAVSLSGGVDSMVLAWLLQHLAPHYGWVW
jgi:asparagine synthetase B (glutamine-hydrolysing)